MIGFLRHTWYIILFTKCIWYSCAPKYGHLARLQCFKPNCLRQDYYHSSRVRNKFVQLLWVAWKYSIYNWLLRRYQGKIVIIWTACLLRLFNFYIIERETVFYRTHIVCHSWCKTCFHKTMYEVLNALLCRPCFILSSKIVNPCLK